MDQAYELTEHPRSIPKRLEHNRRPERHRPKTIPRPQQRPGSRPNPAEAHARTLDVLNRIARENSFKAYREPKTPQEYLAAQMLWVQKMTTWSEEIKKTDPRLYKQIKSVAGFIYGADAQVLSAGRIDWMRLQNSLYKTKGMTPVEVFVSRLKSMPDIRRNSKGMEQLSRIFGEEVHASLFGQAKPQVEVRKDQSERAIWKAYRAGKISPEKRDKYLRQVDARAERKAYQVNNVEIDGRFTAEERARIQAMIGNVPRSLRKNLVRIRRLNEDHFAAGTHQAVSRGRSEIGVNPKHLKNAAVNGEHRPNYNAEGYFYHEVMGHALRQYVSRRNPEALIQLNRMMNNLPDYILIKDLYARKYRENNPQYARFNFPRLGLRASAEEFWANRMAEHMAKKSGQSLELHQDPGNPFARAEQEYISQVCEQILLVYRQVSGDRN